MRYLAWICYLAIPAAFCVHALAGGKHFEPMLTFLLAGIGIIPLARLMGEATENLARRTGPTWGGLLNATFGNAAELIIGIVGITRGLNDIVKASLTGSILGNLLLVSGGAMVVGGWKREKQIFNRKSAEANAGLLTLAVSAMLMPAIFHYSYRQHDPLLITHEHSVSIGTSIILLIVYCLGLLFTLRTHRHIFSPPPSQPDPNLATPQHEIAGQVVHQPWSVRRSVLVLLTASAVVAVVAELLVGSVEKMADGLGWNHVFVGVILLAVIGNAAEHSTAIMLAKRNDMDTAMNIAHQSSLQIALFAVPLLVLLSSVLAGLGIGHASAMDLIFSPMEVVAVALCVGIVVVLGLDGETNWFEGALLLAVYLILGIAFFYIPGHTTAGYDLKIAPATSTVRESGDLK